MFYQDSFVRSLLKCDQCDKIFIDDEKPKSLPCGNSICSDCELKMEEKAINMKFKCDMCSNEHIIPEEGFGIHKIIHSLISAKPKRISRGRQYEILTIYIQNMELLMRDLVAISDNGVLSIKDQSSKQKLLIELTIENKIRELRDLNTKLQERMKSIEKDNIQNFSNKIDSIKQKNNVIIEETKDFLVKNIEYLKEYQIDDNQIEASNKMAEKLILKLEKEKKTTNASIFNDVMINFKPSEEKIDEKLIGCFEYELIGSHPKEIFSQSNDDYSILLLDLNSAKTIKKYEGHTGAISYLKQTLCGKLISGGHDGLIKIWNSETAECLNTIDEQSGFIKSVLTVSPDTFVVSFSENNALKSFDLNTGNIIKSFVGHAAPINNIEKLTNDKIVTGSDDHTLRIYNSKSGLCIKALNGHICFRVISNEKIISGSLNNTIKIWEVESNVCSKTLKGHNDLVCDIIQLSKDKVASCSQDGYVKVWDIIKGECIKTIKTHSLIEYLYNLSEEIILCCNDTKLEIWNIETENCWKNYKIGSNAIEIKKSLIQ